MPERESVAEHVRLSSLGMNGQDRTGWGAVRAYPDGAHRRQYVTKLTYRPYGISRVVDSAQKLAGSNYPTALDPS
ncbi:hypothetical protein Cob_v004044 [Colletotrichum orbiculare MAFF 240422]|uniref:Uncharacterized protein n=1 Tax=Colletotrichum orbiculare (strain 104-T / ATCC 96160 / CBS 514.97 / LARS 414 / MAFF 240422) TaxID=1213857 RepID=A0A484FYZ7_COLOR|nr:hypothetical protein Cob_v004044 [Colletotrichum orbiculare MAFF 240422]